MLWPRLELIAVADSLVICLGLLDPQRYQKPFARRNHAVFWFSSVFAWLVRVFEADFQAQNQRKQ